MFVCLFFNRFLFLSNSNLKKTLQNNITLRFCTLYHWNSAGHEAFQYLFETIMGCLVPFTLINTCYSSVICRLQSARFHRRAQGSCLILMIIGAFAVFWLPYHIVNLIQVSFEASYVPFTLALWRRNLCLRTLSLPNQWTTKNDTKIRVGLHTPQPENYDCEVNILANAAWMTPEDPALFV